MTRGKRSTPPVSIEFGAEEWQEETGRLDKRSPAGTQAERARREIEDGKADRDWKRCRSEGAPDGTSLPGCLKLYVPLGKQGASDAPYGFVFRFQQARNGSLSLNLVAFGERHPSNANRNKRLSTHPRTARSARRCTTHPVITPPTTRATNAPRQRLTGS